MAIKTDDCDIRDVRFFMENESNGDYYMTLIEYDIDNLKYKHQCNMRFAMSGGKTPVEVKVAIANLYRAMEESVMNCFQCVILNNNTCMVEDSGLL